REHKRVLARRDSILPQSQRGDASGRASSSWRIHLDGTWGKARSLRRQKGARSWRRDFLKIKSCGGKAARDRTEQRREDRQFYIGLDSRYVAKSDPGSCRVCQGTQSDQSE